MTRFARRGTIVTKKPLQASSWAELKGGWQSTCQKCHQQGHKQDECKLPKEKSGSSCQGKPKAIPAIKKDKTQKTSVEQKRERRRAEKQLKRIRLKEKSQKCGFCSEQGHSANECPRRVTETTFGACRQCGSADHVDKDCKGPGAVVPLCDRCKQEGHEEEDCPVESSDDEDEEDSDDLSKRCPLCHERGHQVKGCPDNPRSIYPRGGSCKDCGSVEHKTKLCPTRPSVQDLEEVKVGTLHFGSKESADAFEDETSTSRNNVKMKPKKKKAKIVVF